MATSGIADPTRSTQIDLARHRILLSCLEAPDLGTEDGSHATRGVMALRVASPALARGSRGPSYGRRLARGARRVLRPSSPSSSVLDLGGCGRPSPRLARPRPPEEDLAQSPRARDSSCTACETAPVGRAAGAARQRRRRHAEGHDTSRGMTPILVPNLKSSSRMNSAQIPALRSSLPRWRRAAKTIF